MPGVEPGAREVRHEKLFLSFSFCCLLNPSSSTYCVQVNFLENARERETQNSYSAKYLKVMFNKCLHQLI